MGGVLTKEQQHMLSYPEQSQLRIIIRNIISTKKMESKQKILISVSKRLTWSPDSGYVYQKKNCGYDYQGICYHHARPFRSNLFFLALGQFCDCKGLISLSEHLQTFDMEIQNSFSHKSRYCCQHDEVNRRTYHRRGALHQEERKVHTDTT